MGKREHVDAEPEPPLGDSRAAVLEALRAHGPFGVREAAERTGLHPNTARFHLDGLAEAGLVQKEKGGSGGPGRPRTLYRAVETGEGVRSYRLLARMLTSLVAGTMPDPSGAAVEAGRAWGSYLAERSAPYERIEPDEALERLSGFLSGIGFESRPDLARNLIRLVHCPFREIAEEHREVVCPLHLGLIQGALAEMGAPLSADRLEPFVEPHLCLARLSRPGDA
ncbi:helix-turn-helix transcriptional regulator [Spirillospora albida]|uniref:helix-turn-helix transcriptional regulator n=1 Tax=Spirillospora albida TaxID=58123 RepID=UPI0004C0E9D6|nr:helix-turn-helix domain-containing protein [Spirillospora albida]